MPSSLESDLLHKQFTHAATSTNRGVAITPEMEAAYRGVLNEKDRILSEIRMVQEELRLGELETKELLRQSQNSNDPFVKEQLAKSGLKSTYVPLPTNTLTQPPPMPSTSAGPNYEARALRTGATTATQIALITEPVAASSGTPSIVSSANVSVVSAPAESSPALVEDTPDHDPIPGTIPVTIATLERKLSEFPHPLEHAPAPKTELAYTHPPGRQSDSRTPTPFQVQSPPQSQTQTGPPPVIIPPELAYVEEYQTKQVVSAEYPGTPPPSRRQSEPPPPSPPLRVVHEEEQAQAPIKDMDRSPESESSLMLQRELHMEIAAMHAAIQQRLCLAGGFILLLLILLIFY